MAGETEIVNQTANADLGNAVAGALSNVPGFSSVIQISKAVGIVVLIYLVVLIFKTIVQTKQALRFKGLAKDVNEINKKLDILIGKKKKFKR